jgi:hypothetical protein
LQPDETDAPKMPRALSMRAPLTIPAGHHVWTCRIRFLSAAQGGRRLPLLSGTLRTGRYRPTALPGGPSIQTRDIKDAATIVQYGIFFVDGPETLDTGQDITARFFCVMGQEAAYAAFPQGTAFTVCEGWQIVATGAIAAVEPANAPPPDR